MEVIEDEGLLQEVAGLVEWPVPLLGTIDPEFMELPPPVLQTSMRVHQKFFALRHTATGALAPRFVVVANLEVQDGGREIIAGNERVLRARLSDVKFFWAQDCGKPLTTRVPDLRQVVFHAKAGTLFDRAQRLEALAGSIAATLGFDAASARRAGLLAKADLLTGTVGEFPELQGIIGQLAGAPRWRRGSGGERHRRTVSATRPHRSCPGGACFDCCSARGQDRHFVTLWCAGEKPGGSRDPFALRRAGLGILRIILQNGLRLPLLVPMRAVLLSPAATGVPVSSAAEKSAAEENASLVEHRGSLSEILEFLADRLKFALRDEGVRHDLIDAVFALSAEDDFVRLVNRVKALTAFLGTPDGANLLIAYRRAANILRIEEQRDGRSYQGEADPDRLEMAEEKTLFQALAAARQAIAAELQHERYSEAMSVMARLREPVDRFFDRVTVNAADASLPRQSSVPLSALRLALHTVADFSRIEG